MFIKVCREVLLRYAHASSMGDKDAMLFYLVSLLQIPARALATRSRALDRKPSRSKRKSSLNDRLRHLFQVLRNNSAPVNAPLTGDQIEEPNHDPFLSKINRCLQLKQNGYSSRARQALESSGLADLSDPARVVLGMASSHLAFFCPTLCV